MSIQFPSLNAQGQVQPVPQESPLDSKSWTVSRTVVYIFAALSAFFFGAALACGLVAVSEIIVLVKPLEALEDAFAIASLASIHFAMSEMPSHLYRESWTLSKIAIYVLHGLGLVLGLAGIASILIAPGLIGLAETFSWVAFAAIITSHIVGFATEQAALSSDLERELEEFFQSPNRVQKLFMIDGIEVGIIYSPEGEPITAGFLTIDDPVVIVANQPLSLEMFDRISTKFPGGDDCSRICTQTINGQPALDFFGFR